MSLGIHICINQKILHIGTDIKNFKYLCMHNKALKSLDNIYEISITKDLIIVTTSDPDFRDGRAQAPMIKDDRSVNNINAYNWDGDHMWNIADIVGDIKMAFYGGTVITKEAHIGYPGYDASKVPDGHDLYIAQAGEDGYIIDLDDKKVVEILHYLR